MLKPFLSWILDIVELIISATLASQKNKKPSKQLPFKKTNPNSNNLEQIIPILNKKPSSPNPNEIDDLNKAKLQQPKFINFISQNTKPLEDLDFETAAKKLNIEVAAVKSVFSVESKGSGYLASGRPKILFEAHHFSKFTTRAYDQTHPTISSKTWNKNLYKGGEKEYDRLNQAIELNQSAALKSASWGLFQILGSNYKACGFNCVEDFVEANIQSHSNQLEAFVSFIKSTKLDTYLRNKDWAQFARYYNGAGYAANQYDKKLQEAYNKYTY